MNWKRVTTTTLPNLHVLVVNGLEVGFITKPRDTKFDKNMWRVHHGIGHSNRFLGHTSTLKEAKQLLEQKLS